MYKTKEDTTMRVYLSFLVVIMFLSLSYPAECEDWQVIWGDLHAHSSLSDGCKDKSPEDAYEYASGKCNFLALTEHNHQIDDDEMIRLVNASNSKQFPGFVSIFGQEFSTITQGKSGNHLNVFNITECIPGAMNNNYKKLYSEWLPDYQARHQNEIILCQFNHPKNKYKDYGIAEVINIRNYANDWDAFVEDSNRWVRLIAIVNGPGTDTPGQHNRHADIKDSSTGEVKTWFFYLDKGMRLSPTCNQDTHVDSWGDLTTARTGVWIKGGINRNNLLSALKDGRCFATEDKDLSVWFVVNNHPMGSQLADMGTAALNIKVAIDDKDEPDSTYKVEIYRDVVHDDELAQKVSEGDATCSKSFTTTVQHENGQHELYLVHVIQKDESDDIDDAWTAPIYIGPGSTETDEVIPEESGQSTSEAQADYRFVGSRKSSKYHYPSCKSVNLIKPENLVKYSEAPIDKTLHAGCPVE